MKYDLFISDYDGTLGTAPDIIEPQTVEAIRKFVQKGGVFTVCSGRMYSSIRNICLKYGFKGAVVSYQGAMINDIETGESLFSGGLDFGLAADFADDIIKNGLVAVLDIDDVMYYNKPAALITAYENASKVKGIETPDLAEFTRKTARPVQKVLGLCTPDKTKYFTDMFREKYGGKMLLNSGAPILVEAVSQKCSKRVAVEFLAKYYNIPYKKIIAVGDSSNDVELLNGKWFGVAVGDACEELKNAADEIAVPFSDQPVKYLLEKYCL